jgi:drug/metabolite transporter (DMT)-like permease
MIIARHFPALPFLPASAMAALLSGLIALPFGAQASVSAHDLLVSGLFGITTFAIGLPLFTLGARHLPAIETALIGSLDAPLAPLWVWWALGETPTPTTLIGASIVFGAVGLHLVLESGRARATPGAAAQLRGCEAAEVEPS